MHNNYLTLPVLFAMLSNHFAFTYTHADAWLVLVWLMVIGASIRHFFNLRHQGRNVWAIPVARGASRSPGSRSGSGRPRPSAAGRGRAVLARERHRRRALRRLPLDAPDAARLHGAAAGDRVRHAASRSRRAPPTIEQQAVVLKAMPLGNVTHMTQAERDALGAWIRQGANIP